MIYHDSFIHAFLTDLLIARGVSSTYLYLRFFNQITPGKCLYHTVEYVADLKRRHINQLRYTFFSNITACGIDLCISLKQGSARF